MEHSLSESLSPTPNKVALLRRTVSVQEVEPTVSTSVVVPRDTRTTIVIFVATARLNMVVELVKISVTTDVTPVEPRQRTVSVQVVNVLEHTTATTTIAIIVKQIAPARTVATLLTIVLEVVTLRVTVVVATEVQTMRQGRNIVLTQQSTLVLPSDLRTVPSRPPIVPMVVLPTAQQHTATNVSQIRSAVQVLHSRSVPTLPLATNGPHKIHVAMDAI